MFISTVAESLVEELQLSPFVDLALVHQMLSFITHMASYSMHSIYIYILLKYMYLFLPISIWNKFHAERPLNAPKFISQEVLIH